jgi:hypothetical protein
VYQGACLVLARTDVRFWQGCTRYVFSLHHPLFASYSSFLHMILLLHKVMRHKNHALSFFSFPSLPVSSPPLVLLFPTSISMHYPSLGYVVAAHKNHSLLHLFDPNLESSETLVSIETISENLNLRCPVSQMVDYLGHTLSPAMKILDSKYFFKKLLQCLRAHLRLCSSSAPFPDLLFSSSCRPSLGNSVISVFCSKSSKTCTT